MEKFDGKTGNTVSSHISYPDNGRVLVSFGFPCYVQMGVTLVIGGIGLPGTITLGT